MYNGLMPACRLLLKQERTFMVSKHTIKVTATAAQEYSTGVWVQDNTLRNRSGWKDLNRNL